KKGSLQTNDTIHCKVDPERRRNLTHHHSGTHLLNGALRSILGNHIMQKASLVSDNYLRFDFSHPSALSQAELDGIEAKVNEAIAQQVPVATKVLPLEEAKKTGAVAAFDEKYGAEVRVIQMGDYSTEFCGGCHVENTAEIDYFAITKESSPGAGNRRIEAVCGEALENYYLEEFAELQKRQASLEAEASTLELAIAKSSKQDVLRPEQIKKILASEKAQAARTLKKALQELQQSLAEKQEQIGKAKKQKEKSKSKDLLGLDQEILATAIEKSGIQVMQRIFDSSIKVDALKQLGDKLKNKAEPVVVLFAIDSGKSATLLYMANKFALEKNINCNHLLKETSAIVGGRGGGKPDMAQGGGKDASKIPAALQKAIDLIV
ncbi:MAG: DHHA1 domain-containing protein, partial [Spirochaetota bacterium]